MYDLRVEIIRKDAGLALLFIFTEWVVLSFYMFKIKLKKVVLLAGTGILIMIEMIPVAQKVLAQRKR